MVGKTFPLGIKGKFMPSPTHLFFDLLKQLGRTHAAANIGLPSRSQNPVDFGEGLGLVFPEEK